MPRSHAPAEVESLVLRSSRELERAARELVPEPRDPDGRPLTLGPRMYRLRDRLDADAWAAFHAWSRERNAYVHGESDAIADPEAFRANFETALAGLEGLAEQPDPGESESLTLVVAAVVAAALWLLYAC